MVRLLESSSVDYTAGKQDFSQTSSDQNQSKLHNLAIQKLEDEMQILLNISGQSSATLAMKTPCYCSNDE